MFMAWFCFFHWTDSSRPNFLITLRCSCLFCFCVISTYIYIYIHTCIFSILKDVCEQNRLNSNQFKYGKWNFWKFVHKKFWGNFFLAFFFIFFICLNREMLLLLFPLGSTQYTNVLSIIFSNTIYYNILILKDALRLHLYDLAGNYSQASEHIDKTSGGAVSLVSANPMSICYYMLLQYANYIFLFYCRLVNVLQKIFCGKAIPKS